MRFEEFLEKISSRYITAMSGIDDHPMTRALKGAFEATSKDTHLLIQGESGSGRHSLARLIHEWGTRRHQRLLKMDVGSIDFDESGAREQVLKRLFGWIEPGGLVLHTGILLAEEHSSIILTGIDNLPVDVQQALARALRNKKVMPLGEDANHTMSIDPRIFAICTDPASMEESGDSIDQSLLDQFDGTRIVLPQLRERAQDVMLLFAHFWNESLPSDSRFGQIDFGVLTLLADFDWRGNVRSIQALVRVACQCLRGEPLRLRIVSSILGLNFVYVDSVPQHAVEYFSRTLSRLTLAESLIDLRTWEVSESNYAVGLINAARSDVDSFVRRWYNPRDGYTVGDFLKSHAWFRDWLSLCPNLREEDLLVNACNGILIDMRQFCRLAGCKSAPVVDEHDKPKRVPTRRGPQNPRRDFAIRDHVKELSDYYGHGSLNKVCAMVEEKFGKPSASTIKKIYKRNRNRTCPKGIEVWSRERVLKYYGIATETTHALPPG